MKDKYPTSDSAQVSAKFFNHMDREYELVSAFADRFIQGGSFATIVEARERASKILGTPVVPGTAIAKLVDESVERGLVRAAKIIATWEPNPDRAYAQLVDLYQRQPTLGTRSSTSIAQQAYSTPVPIAYLAAMLAQITLEKTVYEPTAGNGALLLAANPTFASVNELNPSRAADLRRQGYTVTQADAVTYFPAKQHDIVIANPPFNSVVDESGRVKLFNLGRYSTTQIDHAIALNALKVMKPEGRAVLILGGKLGAEAERSSRYNSRESRAFYFTLYREYNVIHHFSIWGDLYRRQGAGFPIDLIAIAGKGKSSLPLPAAAVPRIYRTFDELKEVLDVAIFERTQRLDAPRPTPSMDGSIGPISTTGDRDAGGISGTALPAVGVGDLSHTGRVATSGFALPTDRAGDGTGRNEPISAQQTGLSPPVGGGSHPAQLGALRQDGSVPERGISGRSSDEPAADPSRPRSHREYEAGGMAGGTDSRLNRETRGPEAMQDELSPAEDRTQQPAKQLPYIPKSQATPVGTLIPANMQASTARALDALEQRVGALDEYAADRLGYGTPQELHRRLSAEQVDACALALSNLEKGSGFVIGDQTGVGKGRVVASIIRYARITGKTPIFVTQNKSLYADMLRDLKDIGMPNFRPFPTDSDLNIPLDDYRSLKTASRSHQTEIENFLRTGNLGRYDGIFTTYSQMQSVKGKETLRREFLRAFAANAILILDESHEAGGTKSERQPTGVATNRAAFARELIELSAGVFYSSATYAKRPDVMDLYAKTDMRLAVHDMNTLVSIVERGGVPMQQALAAQLTQAGQYVRRERSYEGVNFNLEIVPVDRPVAEAISSILADILEFDRHKQDAVKELDATAKAEAKAILGDTSTGMAGAKSTNFTSIMHNLIDQSLLAMKAEQTVQKCLSLLRQPDPEKPLIALSNTMGSFINDYAKLNQLSPGDEIKLDFGDLLVRYLERSRDVLIGNPYGDKERHRLTDEELGVRGVAAYTRILDRIEQIDLSAIPISPIDYIKSRLSQEGYSVNEVTGRKDVIDYAADGTSTYQQRSSQETSKAAAIANVRAFNNGQLDVIILNRSGSTGISLHACAQFADRRPRHMIVVQPEKEINSFMQMLGRIHRTGQVVLPSFTLLNADIPAEKRPAAVLAKKMASLNANTTAARSSGISLESVVDFMNEYGDRVAAELLLNDPGLNRQLADPLGGIESAQSVDNAGLMNKVTGRLPLLPLVQQERVYARLEREYAEYVERQETMGESVLEARFLDLDAKTVARMEVIAGDPDSNSPFTSPVNVEVVDAKTPRKPVTTLEAINLVRENLNLELVEAVEAHDFDSVNICAKQQAEATRQQLLQATQSYRTAATEGKTSAKTIEKIDNRLNVQLQHVSNTLETFPLGKGVRVVTETGNIFYGVVGKIWSSNREENESPVTPNRWKMQIVLADPARYLTLPFSQINTLSSNSVTLAPEERNWDGVEIYQAFDLKQSKNRESRQIFTGNLLRAYEKFQGKIVNYTDDRGRTHQGLLAPQGFDIESALEQQPVIIPTARQIVTFLTEVTDRAGQVKTLDETLTIKPQRSRYGDGFIVQTAKSRNDGGAYYLDPSLLGIIGGEFHSIGDRMEAVVSPDRIASVLEFMEAKGLRLAAFEKQDIARNFLGITLPSLQPVESESVEVSDLSVSQDRLPQPAKATPVPIPLNTQTHTPSVGNGERQVEVDTIDEASSGNTPGGLRNDHRATEDEKIKPTARLKRQISSGEVALQIADFCFQAGAAEKNVAKLLHQAGLAVEILQGEDFHLKVENEPYIPLSIERHGRELYLTHFLADSSGDLTIDSEMVFRISWGGQLALTQTAVQNPLTGGEERRQDRGFAKTFSENLLEQGFATAARSRTIAQQAVPQESSSTLVDDPTEPSKGDGRDKAKFRLRHRTTEVSHPDTNSHSLPFAERRQLSPLLQEYLALKDRSPQALVLQRVGDFYEAFFQDATVVAKDLELVLASKNSGSAELGRIPMTGFPHHALERYKSRLEEMGHTVVVFEQAPSPSVPQSSQTSPPLRRTTIQPTAKTPRTRKSKQIPESVGVQLSLFDLSTNSSPTVLETAISIPTLTPPVPNEREKVEDNRSSQQLWEDYSRGVEARIPIELSKTVALKALQNNLSCESIVQILQYDPEVKKLYNREERLARKYIELIVDSLSRVQPTSQKQLQVKERKLNLSLETVEQ
ncbi:strawberry notch C-terminal domain-containing protein [Chroococcidiopsis sp. FACHB-1243]|uniref:strawberry notch C-terminal domain-containing protein n=1 Tax=Chroococcidiopsis sp. [FACHB-1243] TaxID=2692781 RepID=UPI00177AD109|nr:strawberry notch C-terminal domain-containing protein [Chroococcidiopsis sp. [FACHB-1243]]MBD2305647.1 strawberry notch C-terminal domain-containing protein [Chroococcidiopsis sp. [FACHB-1243]]